MPEEEDETLSEVFHIRWVDPYVIDRPWNSESDLDEKIGHMWVDTVGYIARETEEFVVLAQGYSNRAMEDEVEEWGHCWVIPKICILSKSSLTPPLSTPLAFPQAQPG